MAQQVGVLEIMLMANMAKLSQDMNAATKVVGDATGQMERHIASAKNAMSGLGMGVGLAAMTDQLRRATDAYVKLDAQVRINTKSQEQYNQALGDIHRIATTAQADIAATSMLYTRLKSTMDGTGVSMKQIATVTETVTYGLKAYGATSAEAASAALQLSQAMGSGRLGGEEFRAVMEAMPNVMKILAESMGVPLGRLRELSIAGQITADELVKAFGNEATAEGLKKLAMESMTITGALQVLRNEFTLYVGEAGKTSGVTKALTDSVMFLADNLKLVGQAMLFTAAIAAGKFMASIIESTTMVVVHTAALKMNADFNLKLAEAKMVEVAATEAQIAATRSGTACALVALPTTEALTVAQKELAAARAVDAASAITWGTSVSSAMRIVGVAISTFIVAHPLIALAAAITAVIAVISEWETVVKGAKVTFEYLKEAFNAIHFAVGAFGIAVGSTTQKLAFMAENWKTLINRDAADRGSFDAKIKALDDLATAQKQALANEISGHTASVKAAEEAAAGQLQVNQKVMDAFKDMTNSKDEARQAELMKLATAYGAAMRLNKTDKDEQIALGKRYNDEVARINAKYDAGRVKAAAKTADALRKAEQDRMDDMLEDEMKFIRERIKAEDARIKLANANIEARAGEEEALKRKIDAAEWELSIIGKTKEAVEELKAARAGESIAHLEKLKESGILDADELAHIQKKIDLLHELKGVREKTAAAQAELAEQKKIEQAEKDRWKMVDSLAHDTFMNIANKGKNAFKEIGASIKTYLLEMLYKMTVQKFLINVGLSGAGGMVAGAAQAAGGGDGGLSLSGIGSALSIGGSTFGTGAMTAITNGAGIMGNLSAGASLVGTGTAGGIGAGIGMMAPYAVAALVVAQAAGLFKKGGGPQQGEYGQIGPGGYSAGITMSGGDSLGNKALTESAYAQVNALASSFGKTLTDVMVDQGYKLDPKGTSQGLAYRKIIVGGKELTSGGTTFGKDDAAAAAGYLGKLHTDELMVLIKEISDPKLSAAADALMQNFGELENSLPAYLTAQAIQKAAAYSLMDETEKTAEKTKLLEKAFAELGVAVPASTADFKTLMGGIDATTAEGQKQIAGLNGLIAAYVELHPAAKQAADNAEALAEQMRDVDTALAELAMSPLEKSLHDITSAMQASIDKARALAATESDLAKIRELGAKQAAALVSSAAASAYAGLLDSTGNKAGASQFKLSQAQSAYDAALASVANKAGVGSDAAKKYIDEKGGIAVAVKAYWDELDVANVGAADERRVALIDLANAASALAAAQVTQAETSSVATDAAADNSAAMQLAAQRRQMEIALMEAQGNATGALAERRKDELAAMDESLRGIQSAIWAAQDAAATAATLLSWQNQLDVLTGKKTQKEIERAMQLASVSDKATIAIMKQVFALQDLADVPMRLSAATDSAMDVVRRQIDAQKKIIQVTRDAADEQIKSIKSVMDTLRDGIKTLRSAVAGSVLQSGAAGMDFIANALNNAKTSGYLPDRAQLQDAISAATAGLDAKLYTSQVEADRDRLRVANQLEELNVIGGDQLTNAEKALLLAEKQLKDLDDQLSAAQSQIDLLRGINSGVTSVTAAIAALGVAISAEAAARAAQASQSAMAAASQVPTVSAGGAMSSITSPTMDLTIGGTNFAAQSLLGIAGMTPAAASAQVSAMVATSDSATAAAISGYAHDAGIPGFASGTSYVPYDMMANIHQGEEITPRPFVDAQKESRDRTNALLDRLIASTEAATADIADLKRTNRLIWQTEDKWDIDGIPATRV